MREDFGADRGPRTQIGRYTPKIYNWNFKNTLLWPLQGNLSNFVFSTVNFSLKSSINYIIQNDLRKLLWPLNIIFIIFWTEFKAVKILKFLDFSNVNLLIFPILIYDVYGLLCKILLKINLIRQNFAEERQTPHSQVEKRKGGVVFVTKRLNQIR